MGFDVATVARIALVAAILYAAYDIRLYAVAKYGKVIHEFDPWFNFRAAEYLVDNGWTAFFNWFDDKSWYPIGRNVGHSIYPGLQITAAAIYHVLNAFGFSVTITDVCVYIPAYFGSFTTFFTLLLAAEVTGSWNAGVASAAVMAILPAHLMRSVAGGFDNESIALTAIVATFYFWLRTVRSPGSWFPWAFITAFSYIYMVAAWGAYVFVLNMIGLHAGLLVLLGRFNSNLHIGYSIFYVIGTIGALHVYPVGWQPLQSAEQLMPMLVFFGLHVWAYIERSRAPLGEDAFYKYRRSFIAKSAAAGIVILILAAKFGYLGPLSSRVSSLFIPHTRTGNPLVDSVAEHQPTRSDTFFSFFHVAFYLAPFGLASLFPRPNEARIFGIALTLVSFYFSRKMTRLVLLLSPGGSICAGAAIAIGLEWAVNQILTLTGPASVSSASTPVAETPKQKKSIKQQKTGFNPLELFENLPQPPATVRLAAAASLLVFAAFAGTLFWGHCQMLAEHLSEPQVVLSARGPNGPVVIDDFREAYWWLRDNTPEDSRVMAWWDYGYQINGIANRTSIADGNTWNFEHIALLGRTLVSTEEEAHKVARHLADYVLVWTCRHIGMYNDDLAKMPQLSNIAGSIYPEIERMGYYVDKNGVPSPKARESLLYKMTFAGFDDTIKLTKFKEVYTTKHRMVRIFKVLERAKRPPFGDYPPEIKPLVGQYRG